MTQSPRIAVLLPCYNEEPCIAGVITAFRQSLPDAIIYVYDNNSKDNTAQVAREAGAIVRTEIYQGKGNVVRRMFSDIDADIYVMADGDGTYDASAAPELIRKLVGENLDMVVGSRVETESKAYRHGHKFGNFFLTSMVKYLFGFGFTDILSGYRIMSRRYVKSFPIGSSGFEIETEMSVHTLQLRLPVAEVPTQYGVRPEEAPSKLNTYRDGFRILFTIFGLMTSERPRLLFGVIAAILAMISILLSIPLFVTWFQTGNVPRFPTAILCVGTMLLAATVLAFGWLLHAVTRGRVEAKRLAYLAQKSVSSGNTQ
ncbi:MAG: glycosyltransferase [Planctomycetaceae bacterium]|nr:glycosyltransferase [Planctomycetaceae bacterium]